MFPLIERNLPQVERLVLAYLGPRDLIRAKSVCRKWRQIIQVVQKD